MELKHYLRMLWAGWWIPSLAILAGVALALTLSYMATPFYRASARMLVRPNLAVVSSSGLVDSLSTLDKRSIVSTYAEILKSNRLYSDAITGLPLAPQDLLLYTHSTVALPDSNILDVSVEGPNPEICALIANNLGQHAINYIKSLYQAYSIDFLDPAVVPVAPFTPQPLRDATVAALLGAVLGSMLAILREQFRTPLELLYQLRMVDGVTDAYTRRSFQRKLQEELAANPPGMLSVGLVELSGLQDLSDALPEAIANRLLRRVVQILKSELRGSDMVGHWDDNTFSILLLSTPEPAARRTLDRIRMSLADPLSLDGPGSEQVRLQPHIGASTAQESETLAELMRRAKTDLEQNRQKTALATTPA